MDLQNILSFLHAFFLHFDCIEVIEFAQTKVILYSLKITRTQN